MIEYPELEQRSEEWYAARCGIVTASTVGLLISKQPPLSLEMPCADCDAVPGKQCVSLRDGKPIKTIHTARTQLAASKPARLVTADNETSRGLILSLAAERITGHIEESFPSRAMQRGIDEEPFARDEYAKNYGEVTELGFCTEDKWGFTLGYSPDGLVGADGLLEIKSRNQKTQVATVLDGQVPDANMAQLQCGLLVTGRKWIDYLSFSNGMHLWPHRVFPDKRWFDAITDAVCAAEEQIQQIVTAYETATANLPATERIPNLDEIEVA